MAAALIVAGDCRAETVADNNKETMQYIEMYAPQLSPTKNNYNI